MSSSVYTTHWWYNLLCLYLINVTTSFKMTRQDRTVTSKGDVVLMSQYLRSDSHRVWRIKTVEIDRRKEFYRSPPYTGRDWTGWSKSSAVLFFPYRHQVGLGPVSGVYSRPGSENNPSCCLVSKRWRSVQSIGGRMYVRSKSSWIPSIPSLNIVSRHSFQS